MIQRSENLVDLFGFTSCSDLIYNIEKTFDLDQETFVELKQRLRTNYPILPLEVKGNQVELQNDPKQETQKSIIQNMKKWRNQANAYFKRALEKDLVKKTPLAIMIRRLVERINFELQIWKVQPITLE